MPRIFFSGKRTWFSSDGEEIRSTEKVNASHGSADVLLD